MESRPEPAAAVREKWDNFEVVTTRKDSRKASLFSAPGNLEIKTPSANATETSNQGSSDVIENGANNGDVTLLNNNGKAPKRRLSSYTLSTIEKTGKSGRKRSSLVPVGLGKFHLIQKTTIKNF